MSAANVGLAVAEAAGCIVFACAGARLWKAGDRTASLACWLVACAALGFGAFSTALCAGLPA